MSLVPLMSATYDALSQKKQGFGLSEVQVQLLVE